MKNVLLATLFAVLGVLYVDNSFAQTGQSKSVTINWTLPTKNTDGSTIDASAPLTKVQVFLANASIADNSTMAPTVELSATSTTTTRTFTVFPGGSLFARVKACNAQACSDFSVQAAIPIPVSVPGVPTSVTLQLVVAP